MIAKASLGLGNSGTLAKLSSLEDACGMASGINNCIDTVVLFSQFATGAMFYEVDSTTGNFIIDTKTIQQEDGTVQLVSNRVLRSPLSIASKVTRLASKATGSVCFGGDLKLMTLGKHARGLGGVATSLSAISSACSAADDVVNIVGAIRSTNSESSAEDFIERRQTLREKFFSLLCNIVDLLGDILSLFASFAPALLGPQSALIIGIFWLMSSVLNFVQDFIG
ncbi:hypothetical protein SBV42_01970 [Chlamydia crocodili]|uniref:Uncharacterized protein n=1 Tax=Chlamydia crocodili TaxID=2766982 RepID=A0ABX8CF17_9CHLA|nr:hypothetical protein [Chlamydia crocodili]QVE49599.1 hypothetical protein H9Q19_02350 [Chlamydia crocodili]